MGPIRSFTVKESQINGFRDILIETYINPVTFILEQHKVEIG